MQAGGGTALHLDDAYMQGVSHSRREMSLNRGSSGGPHKQTTHVVKRDEFCVGCHGADKRGVMHLGLQLGFQLVWQMSGSRDLVVLITPVFRRCQRIHPQWWPGERPMGS